MKMGDTSKNVPSYCEGLSILLVDNDEKSLTYLSSMLQQFSYEVTTTELATTALLMVEEQKDKFNLVIENVNIPDMDPLQFLHSLLDKEIPVILVARNRSESYAKKMLAEGASFYLSEPVFPDDLKYLWQHAYRNKTIPTEDVDKVAMNDEETSPNEVEGADIIGPMNADNTELTENNNVNGQKRQNDEKEGQNDKGKKAKITDEVQIIKCKSGKTRVVWTPELHLKFTEAITNLGDKKARPKPILELMDVKNLTARQVASHLQKYRSTVKRIYENGIAELPPATKTPDFYHRTSVFSNTNASSSSHHYHPTPASDSGVTGTLIDLVKASSNNNGGPAMTPPFETSNQAPSWKKQEMDILELIKSLDDGYKKVDVSNPDNSQHQQANNVTENSNYISSTGENLGNSQNQQASNVVETSKYVSSAGENLGDEDGFDEWINEILMNMDETEMPNLDMIMGSNEDMVNMAETSKIVDEPIPSDFDGYLKWAAQILLEDD